MTPIVSVSESESPPQIDSSKTEVNSEIDDQIFKNDEILKKPLELTPSLIDQRKRIFNNEPTETLQSNAPSEIPEISMSIDPVSLDQPPRSPSPDNSESTIFSRKRFDEYGPVLDSPLPTPSKLSFSMPRKPSNREFTPNNIFRNNNYSRTNLK